MVYPEKEFQPKPEVVQQPHEAESLREKPGQPELVLVRPQESKPDAPQPALPKASSANVPATPTAAQSIAAEVQKDVERVLAEDLADEYQAMNPAQRAAFKKKGEETAKNITTMLLQAKVHFGKFVNLIRSWLQLIPGIQRLFLEQESKLKADELVRYAQEDLQRKIKQK